MLAVATGAGERERSEVAGEAPGALRAVATDPVSADASERERSARRSVVPAASAGGPPSCAHGGGGGGAGGIADVPVAAAAAAAAAADGLFATMTRRATNVSFTR